MQQRTIVILFHIRHHCNRTYFRSCFEQGFHAEVPPVGARVVQVVVAGAVGLVGVDALVQEERGDVRGTVHDRVGQGGALELVLR